MTAVCLWLASVLAVVGRWSTDLDVIFIIYDVHCTVMIEDKQIDSFLAKKAIKIDTKQACKKDKE